MSRSAWTWSSVHDVVVQGHAARAHVCLLVRVDSTHPEREAQRKNRMAFAAQKNTGATALAFDLILLCERDCGCCGRLSLERDVVRKPCSKSRVGARGDEGALGGGVEPVRVEMKVA